MKNLYVGCRVRVVDDLPIFDVIFWGSILGAERVIVDKVDHDQRPWVIMHNGHCVYANEAALEPILPDGLQEMIENEVEESYTETQELEMTS